MFQPQVRALASRYRTIAFDHRARTPRWRDPYDLYDLAADCRSLLRELKVDSCILAGMSMGACMALRVGLVYPDLVKGLILLSGFVTPYTHDEQVIWEAHYGQLRGAMELPLAFVEEEAQLCFGDKAQADKSRLVDLWKRRWRTYCGDAVYLESLSWIRQDDVRRALRAVRVPTVIIHGGTDAAVPAHEAATLADLLPRSTLVMIENAGHTVNLEQPDAVNEAIATFIEDVYT